MEFVWSFISGLFIAIVIGTALAFGAMMLFWIVVAAVTFALAIYMRDVVRRWLFMRQNAPEPPATAPRPPRANAQQPKIIEGEYKDLTD